jgi:LacI family transcriptional regulator
LAASIEEIAELAGVSPRTVSNALRGTGKGVRSDAVKRAAKIKRIARDLGYRPHGAARAMRRGSFRAIGVVSSQHPSAGGVSSDMQWAMQQRLMDEDFHMVLGHLPDEKLKRSDQLPRLFREWMVDGVVISYTVNAPQPLVDALDNWKLPAVWVNVKRETDTIRPDDFGSAREATAKLIELGHRRVAYVDRGGEKYLHYSIADRRDGYVAAMQEAGLTPEILTPPAADRDETTGAPQVDWACCVLRQDDRPTACLAYSDLQADWCLEAARETGLAVPRDLSIMGYAINRRHVASRKRLGTLALNHSKIGEQIVDMLLEKIETPEEPLPARLLPVDITFGDTVAPPGGPAGQ